MSCTEVVAKGKQIDELPSEEYAYKVRSQCLKYESYFVRIEGGDPRKLRPVSMERGGDGVYAYLFDQGGLLHTAKVFNQFEIGSLHMTLAYEGKVKAVLASGEMKKTGSRVEFNLLSGSYMLPWMVDDLDSKCDKEVQDQAAALFRKAGLEPVYIASPFITAKIVPVTKSQLNTYVDAGFVVKLFTERKKCLVDEKLLNAKIEFWKRQPVMYKVQIEEAERELAQAQEFTLYTKGGRWKMPRKMTRRYCKKTPCKRMGFTQRASCRPWKNCYR